MKTVSVSQLKARLSEHLRRVKRGEQVVVTERNRPVAMLVAVPPAKNWEEEEFEDLVRLGLATPAKGPIPDEVFSMPRPKDPSGLLARALLEEREQGW